MFGLIGHHQVVNTPVKETKANGKGKIRYEFHRKAYNTYRV
jgi:hypothetical protein